MRILNYKKRAIFFIFFILLSIPNLAFSLSELFSFNRQGIKFSLLEDGNHIVLKANNPKISGVNKFALTNPARLVIDITGIKIGKSENINVTNVPQIKTIRLGGHPPYTTRLVIDLKSDVIPSYTTFLQQGELTVMIAKSLSETQASAQTFTQPTTQVPAKVETRPTLQDIGGRAKLSEPNVIKINRLDRIEDRIEDRMQDRMQDRIENRIESVPTKAIASMPTTAMSPPSTSPSMQDGARRIEQAPTKASPTLVPAREMTIKEAEKSRVPLEQQANLGDSSQIPCVLSAVFFDTDASNSSIVKISLNKKADFTISKASSELYKLTIPNCKLMSKNLELPFFPPPEFQNVIFIQAKENVDHVEVTIGVEENSVLNYLQRNSEIWIKPQN
ncbi:MAG: AMIN domain-containing protein [Bdellovibrionota bacterium]